MTAMQLPVRECDAGRVVVLGGRNVFKLGIILGPSRATGKARVCSWSNQAKSWSTPFTMHWVELHDLYGNMASTDDQQERTRRMAVARRASAAAVKAPGFTRGWGWL